MGCWNKTCGLSRLPIYSGEAVYVFPILANLHNSGRCYTTALYTPILLPFEADYNDYGGGCNDRGVALSHIMSALRKHLVEVPQETNDYYDFSITKDAFTLATFYQAVGEGKLYIKHSLGTNHFPVDYVMIKQNVAHHILNTWTQRAYVKSEDDKTQHVWVQYTFQDVLADVDVFLKMLHTKIKKEGDGGYNQLQSMMDLMEMDHTSLASHKAQWYLYQSSLSPNRWVLSIADLIRRALVRDNYDEARELLVCNLTGLFIDAFYRATRNVWVPGCHEGSQNGVTEAYKVLGDVLSSVEDRWE